MSVITERPKSWTEFDRKGEAILKELQKVLLPEHTNEIIAIDVESGDYYLGKTSSEALAAFRQHHPDRVAWMARVDGGPVVKYHGRVQR